MHSKSIAAIFAASAVSLFAETHNVTDISAYASAAGALRVKTGDVIVLPELAEGSYSVANARIAALRDDGFTLDVTDTGILGVNRLSADGATINATMGVLSLPDAGNGRIFIWNESHWDSGKWCSTDGGWRLVGAETTADYPHLPGDIAIMPRYNDGWGKEVTVSSDVTVSGVYYGNMRDFDNYNDAYAMKFRSDNGSALTLAGVNGGPAVFRFCPNTRPYDDEHKLPLQFGDGGQPIVLNCATDVDVDLGWGGADSRLNLALMLWTSDSTLHVAENTTLSFINGAPHQKGAYHADIKLTGVVTGSGTIHNRSRENLLCNFSDASGFSGTLMDSSREHESFDRDGTLWFQDCDTLQNAAARIDGYVVRSDYKSYPKNMGAGFMHIGSSHTWPGQKEVGNRLPGRALILNGGHIELLDEQKAWSEGAANLYVTSLIAVSNGFSFITVSGNNNIAFPDTYFKAENVEHANKATVAVRCNRLWTTSNSTKVEMNLPWFAGQAIGGIVPWIAGWRDQADYGGAGGWESFCFPVADADGNLRAPTEESTSVGEADDNANVICDGKDISIAADKTINSLVLKNPYGGEKKIGEGKTLTLASGGLVIGAKTRIGENDWNTSVPSRNCGTLAFGNTAYVFANNPNSDNNGRSWIMAEMIAPYGFVCAFPGFLSICGDQTGIDDEIVVNAGELTLGLAQNNNGRDLELPCLIDVPVRIVGGGSTLAIAAVPGPTLDRDQNVYFEDIGGHAGKLKLPVDAEETCFKCYVDGVALPRGTYGSSESDADFIDDAHFAGAGVLAVRKDDAVQYTTVMLK